MTPVERDKSKGDKTIDVLYRTVLYSGGINIPTQYYAKHQEKTNQERDS